ncbi:MAG: hypothetical protein HY579_09655 [Nitrospinae bacterium]|nr:hypothetical protein [Nitrospinota bacterium]
MSEENRWDEQREDDGLTLGPEDALRKEIEKSKSLKVDRLTLRDEIEKLRAQNASLNKKYQNLKQENEEVREKMELDKLSPEPEKPPVPFPPLAYYLLVFNLLAIGFLIYLQMQK